MELGSRDLCGTRPPPPGTTSAGRLSDRSAQASRHDARRACRGPIRKEDPTVTQTTRNRGTSGQFERAHERHQRSASPWGVVTAGVGNYVTLIIQIVGN